MTREIKFRGLRSDGKGWIEGSYYALNREHYICNEDHSDNADSYFNHKVHPESIGQFTGFKDKNGTEIYEGDQLHICAGYYSVVEFQDGMFVSVYSHPEDGETIPLLDAIGKDTVVIGDVF